MSNSKYKLVILVRGDLERFCGEVSCGVIISQVALASSRCSAILSVWRPTIYNRWKNSGEKIVILRASDMDDLSMVRRKAEDKGYINELILDATLGQFTCLGVFIEAEDITKEFELYRGGCVNG